MAERWTGTCGTRAGRWLNDAETVVALLCRAFRSSYDLVISPKTQTPATRTKRTPLRRKTRSLPPPVQQGVAS